MARSCSRLCLLLSGMGEVSRIGEVILNPFLGPRLKSGVVTTDMPLAHDKPIDFGLQAFCEACNKCARECPSGAITAGPKLMFNGYEIWKSDSQKCATYRITTLGRRDVRALYENLPLEP